MLYFLHKQSARLNLCSCASELTLPSAVCLQFECIYVLRVCVQICIRNSFMSIVWSLALVSSPFSFSCIVKNIRHSSILVLTSLG